MRPSRHRDLVSSDQSLVLPRASSALSGVLQTRSPFATNTSPEAPLSEVHRPSSYKYVLPQGTSNCSLFPQGFTTFPCIVQARSWLLGRVRIRSASRRHSIIHATLGCATVNLSPVSSSTACHCLHFIWHVLTMYLPLPSARPGPPLLPPT